MKTRRRRLGVLIILLSIMILLLGSSSIVYADNYSPALNDIATENNFHLGTTQVLYLPSPANECSIAGNLFSFSHGLPQSSPRVVESLIRQHMITNREEYLIHLQLISSEVIH